LIESSQTGKPFLLVLCNFTPVQRLNYRAGVPDPGVYRKILNGDSKQGRQQRRTLDYRFSQLGSRLLAQRFGVRQEAWW
jgi:1,4-alpha-glucan branching enzyme